MHGGAHGAWCWDRVAAALVRRGHRAIAPELPCDDEDAGVDAYAEAVRAALAGVPGEVVLVGHSLGGLTIPVVASRRPVRRMIFLAAMLPVPGRSLDEQRAGEPGMMLPYAGGRAGLRDRFYNTCTPADADAAMARLRTQARRPFAERTPLERWPDVPATYIICSEDHACDPAWSRRAVRERLGIEPIELAGTGHSPFLDRPEELADVLVREGVRR